MIQKEQPKCPFNAGDIVRLRNSHTLTGGALDKHNKVGDLRLGVNYTIYSIEIAKGLTATGISIKVNGSHHTYCSGWLMQCKEYNIKKLLDKIDDE